MIVLFRILVAAAALTFIGWAAPLTLSAAQPRPLVKRIAITFDDTPRGAGAFLTLEERGPRLLAALEKAGVMQAAFFVNPGRIQSQRDGALVRAYETAGHVLADHTYTHPGLSRVSAERFLADIDKSQAWLRERPTYRPWFRFPYLDEGGHDLAKRDAVRAGLKARGLTNGYVTCDGYDWNMERLTLAAKRAGRPIDMAALRDLYVETHVGAAEFADQLAVRATGRHPAQVLLLHETDLAALFLPDMVAGLRKAGWTIVTADEAYDDPIARRDPEVAFANGTRIQMLAWEKGLKGSRWYDRTDGKLADRLFEARVMHPGAAAGAVGVAAQ
ncbi:polysaccharide deacetylase family protein [Sphingomonas sp.]|uniref:polysaccharide deacetylase family protein n=1 Tax=Sphingomonas sp. TaxID=28214 RepID=UPI001EC8DE15|nr:polysaccharide deacetylase family protein [Sphingomonas sp.]MBX3594412.1 polysaccharide deacetylase family protein [Sphingomonas sp.]